MKTVFIVDDEKSLRENISYALEKEGFRTFSFANGSEAWAAFSDKKPDLLVLDIMMPNMNGLELCRNIRAVDEQAPVIFLSSRDEDQSLMLPFPN